MNASHIVTRLKNKKNISVSLFGDFFMQNFAFTIYAFFLVAYLFYKSYNWLGGQ